MKHQSIKYLFFLNSAHKMLNLSGKDRVLLDFICERMSLNNKITLDSDFYKRYKSFLNIVTTGKTKISDKQIKTSIKKLINEDILFREARGLYIVSPKHFTKNTLKKNREHYYETQEILESTTEDKTLLNRPRKIKKG